MALSETRHVNFDDISGRLQLSQIWEYYCGAKQPIADVTKSVFASLQSPLDFPPMSAAIVPGDRVALAVDPYVPDLANVIRGVFNAIDATEADAVDIVLWDEATDETFSLIRSEFANDAAITRHRSDDRSELRYLAADEAGDPLYVNRAIVDADFAVPIVSTRALDRACQHDLTGIYPTLADSATRNRHRLQMSRPEQKIKQRSEDQIPWLLGVNLITTVTATAAGDAGEITTGTPDAIGKLITPARRAPDDYPPPAALVIASLDGDQQQQTWQNASRALVAASRYTQPGGTIVIWSEIDTEPSGKLAQLDEIDHAADDDAATTVDEQGKFPESTPLDAVAATIARVATEFHVLLHSRIAREQIESIGLGVIETVDELSHLARSLESCGVLRAAQFAGSTVDAPYRQGIQAS